MKVLIKISVLSISLLVILAGSVVSPALGQIGETFSDVDPFIIKLILTLPSIVVIPFSLLSGRISTKVRKKKLLILGLIIYLIGGLGGGICQNIFILLSFRVVLGIGMGFLVPLSRSLIADFFDNDERTRMMGYSNAVSNFGAIFASLIAGWLAIINWRFVFGIYFIAAVVLILILVGLPEPPRRIPATQKTFYINIEVIIIAVLAFLLNIAFYSILTNMAFFIKTENIGKSDSTGLVMSCLPLAGFISGMFLQKISALLKQLNITFAIGFMSIGFFMLSVSYSLVIVIFSVFLVGFGLGILKPLLFLKVTEVTPKFSNAFSISVVSSSIFLGKFMSPLILSFINIIFNNDDIRFIFYFIGFSLAISVVISLLFIVYPIDIFKPKYDK